MASQINRLDEVDATLAGGRPIIGTNKVAELTSDVTGRNIPSLMPSTRWIFVASLDINKYPPPWDIAD